MNFSENLLIYFQKKLKLKFNIIFFKVYVNQILKWLNYKSSIKNKFFIKKTKRGDSFTLNNKKLFKLIKIKIERLEIKKFCKTIGKKIYYQYYCSI